MFVTVRATWNHCPRFTVAAADATAASVPAIDSDTVDEATGPVVTAVASAASVPLTVVVIATYPGSVPV